jgi:hypothetical protein
MKIRINTDHLQLENRLEHLTVDAPGTSSSYYVCDSLMRVIKEDLGIEVQQVSPDSYQYHKLRSIFGPKISYLVSISSNVTKQSYGFDKDGKRLSAKE